MTNTSVRPIWVDGLRLDTLGFNVSSYNLASAPRVTRDSSPPWMDGVLPSTWNQIAPATFAVQMWVRGTDPDGAVPGGDSLDLLRQNLDQLLHLFGQRHKLLDVQQQVDAAGTIRRAWCRVVDVMAPNLNDVGTVAQFTVTLDIVYGNWEDVTTADWTTGIVGTGSVGVTQEVTSAQGATDRIPDAVFLVHGPLQDPIVTDVNTGAWVKLTVGAVMAPTNLWRIDMGNFTSEIGSGLTLSSPPGTGTNGAALTTWGGTPAGGGPYLPLTPVIDTGLRRVQVRLDGTSPGAGTTLTARTKRRWVA